MSADNYGVVHKLLDGSGFGLTMAFMSDNEEPDLSKPFFKSEILEEVIDYADNYYFEYGWNYIPEIHKGET